VRERRERARKSTTTRAEGLSVVVVAPIAKKKKRADRKALLHPRRPCPAFAADIARE